MRQLLPVLAATLLLAGHDEPRSRVSRVGMNSLQPLLDLASFRLSTDALKDDAELAAALEADPWNVNAFKKIVSCALDPTQSITIHFGGEDVVFKGGLGYWASWADGPCDEICQENVSSCFYARWNNYAVPVRLLFVADPTLGAPPDLQDQTTYPIEEGAFFGNFFAQQVTAYSCRGHGYDPLLTTLRVCSRHDCGAIRFLGDCDDHCEVQRFPPFDRVRYFPCYAETRGPDGFPAGSHAFESSTIYLAHSQLGSCP